VNTATAKIKLVERDLTAVERCFCKGDQFFVFLNEYQRAAMQTDQNQRRGMDGLAFPLLGLFGEIGTLLSALKKKQRDKDSYVGYSEAVIEEFGDVLWYFSNVASRAALNIGDLAQRAFHDRENQNGFERDRSGSPNSPEFEAAVIALGGKVGLLLNQFSAGKLGNDRDLLADHLANVFYALVQAASVADVDLQEAARNNIQKVYSRWPKTREHTPLFDINFEESEQLPRKIEMHIVETQVAGKTCVIQLCNDVEIGSRLTDNKIIEDDYRFHDVFHLAYAAILGWSPCLRALFKVKRKSKPEVDETQDGARAILIEEGVSTLVFHHALRLNYFASVKSLDYPLLKAVRDFVSGYEVDQCPLWQWEQAILDGFEVFRKLRNHRRGVVVADLVERSITFKTHPNDR
jgi:NTP pyrophosphatase (non-canonical NTP hydrolase)